jgi:hypothetical protein
MVVLIVKVRRLRRLIARLFLAQLIARLMSGSLGVHATLNVGLARKSVNVESKLMLPMVVRHAKTQ